MSFVHAARDPGIGFSIGNEGPWRVKNVGTTTIVKDSLCAFGFEQAAAETTAADYEGLNSVFYGVMAAAEASATLSQFGFFGLAESDITTGTEGFVYTAGIRHALCADVGGAIAFGNRLQAQASSDYLGEVGATVKMLGILLESMSTTGPERLLVAFNGIQGWR